MSDDTGGLREKLTKQGEEVLGKVAQELLENPLFTGAVTRAFDAREKATQVQEAAMGAFNLPSAADVERLTRRLRSVSQRLEGIEDVLDRIDTKLGAVAGRGEDAGRIAALEAQVSKLVGEVHQVAEAVEAKPAAVHRAQASLNVDGAKPAAAKVPAPKPAGSKPAASKPARKAAATAKGAAAVKGAAKKA